MNDLLKRFLDWWNTQKIKPIQLIFLAIGIIFYAFTYTATFQSFPDWVKMISFIAWSLILLLTGVQMGTIKEVVEKGFAIFTHPEWSLEKKYTELMGLFQIIGNMLGVVFKGYNQLQGTDPEEIKKIENIQLDDTNSTEKIRME